MSAAVRTIPIARDVSSGDFRSAMRHLAGGVSVITAGLAKDITGMTVTSVSSLSVDPPTLIVSINRESSSWPLLKRYGAFGVNILAADQLDIAEGFDSVPEVAISQFSGGVKGRKLIRLATDPGTGGLRR